MKSYVLVSLFLLLPLVAFGEGLVTCTGPDCNFCTFIEMVDKVIKFVFTLMVLGAVLMMVYAGFQLVVSQGNEHAMGEAKGMITNVVIGFVIVMSAWLIVDTMMKALLSSKADFNGTEAGFGMWNSVSSSSCSPAIKDALKP